MMDAGLLQTGAVSCHNAHRHFPGRLHDEVKHPTTRETRFVIVHTGGKSNLLTVQSQYSSQTKNMADHRDEMDITGFEKTNFCPTLYPQA